MKSQSLLPKAFLAISLFAALSSFVSAQAGEMRVLHGHLPEAAALSQPLGRLPGTNSLRLAISLPLHNGQALTNLLQRLYDPASPDYHHYLTPAQFSEQFGPTAQDYQAVIHFAESNGMTATTRDSRMLLDVQGKVSDIEKAFHVNLRTYQHPTESRQFYVPDVEPSVDADLPILDIYGLGNYAVPRPMLHWKPGGATSVPASGSQSSGYYLGSDFRHAYAPGVTLNGAGQMVGLLELDTYYPSDITDYETLAGLTNVPVQPIPLDGFSGSPGADNVEVALDIEMAIAMAPGLTTVYVFEAPNNSGTTGWIDILDSMAASNQIKQFSSSWGYTGSPDPNTSFDTEFQKMATQGQSFYQASGDGNAWINPIWVPADSPYLTSVGGTQLTMNGSGASYNSEAVWNEGNQGLNNGWSANESSGGGRHNQNDYIGSGGGASTVYAIPSWQTNAINSTNQGSTTMRNIPDVALTADDIWVYADDGESGYVGGTSCAAPLWAGFTALINQQAAAGGNPSVGFINPAVYTLGQGANYTSVFHDITSGNNTNTYSTNRYLAVAGYDLCTGWGTPTGAALINALLPALQITPAAGFASSGPYGGPFSVTNLNFVLTNISTAPFNWNLANTSSWMTVSPGSSTLAAGGAAVTVSFGLSSAATNLDVGNYTNTVFITNLTADAAQSRQFILTISKATPALAWNPAAITYGAALTASQLDATANTSGGFVYSPPAGMVLTAGAHTLSVVFTPGNTTDYTSTTNTVNLTVSPASLTVTASNATRIYGTANPAFTGSITGVTNGDNITATYSCSAMANSPVGTYSIVPILVDPNNRLTNYVASTNNGTLTVTMATPVLGWTTPSSITYGTALSPVQLDATANTSGGFVYNPPAGTVVNKGTNILSVIFTPSDAVDYTSANDSTSLAVSPAPLNVTASNVSQTYGQTNPVFTGTITGEIKGDNITATYSCSATNNSPVGTYPIVPILVDPNNRLTNYIASTNNGTFTITMATPVLTWAAPAGVTYPSALGSIQLDATANVTGGFAYNPSAGTVPGPGTNVLGVLFTPDDAVDYSNAIGSVSLTVSLAPITLTIQLVNNNVILSWDDPDSVFALQAAPAATGVFTNVPGAASPFTNAVTGAQQFFRLMSN